MRRGADAQQENALVGAAMAYAVLAGCALFVVVMNCWPARQLTRGRPTAPDAELFYGCEDFADCPDILPDYKWSKDKKQYCDTHHKLIDVPCHYE